MILSIVKQNILASRWLLLAHVVLSLTAAFPLEPVSDLTALFFGLLSTGFFFTAIAIFARVVQGNARLLNVPDTEAQLSPYPVFLATFIMALVIMLPPLMTQAIAIQRFAVPAVEVPGLLGESAVFVLLLLAGTGAVAALTRSGMGFVGALILLVLAAQAIKSLMGLIPGYEAPRDGDFVSLAVVFIPLGVAALIILHQYRTNNTRRGIILGSAAFLIGQVGPAPNPPLTRRIESHLAVLADSLRPVELRFRDDRIMAHGVRETPGWLTMQSPIVVEPTVSRYKHVLRVRQIRMSHAGKVELLTPPAKAIAVYDPAIELGPAMHWMVTPEKRYPFYAVSYRVTRAQRKVLETTGADIEIDAQLELLEPRVVTLPFAENSVLSGPGERTRVDRIGDVLVREGISLSVVGIGSGQRRTRIEPRWYSVALANERRGEAVPLWHSEYGEEGVGLPIGLISRSARHISLFVEDSSRVALFRAGKAWLDEAHLRLTDWVSVGAYPVTISGSVHIPTAMR